MTHEDDGLFTGFPGERDLADERLWARSIERARRSRRVAEVARRSRRRRKATTVALTGAVATSPVAPALSVAGAQVGSGSDAGKADDAPQPDRSGSVLLEFGSTGPQVAQVQQRLAVDDDGIFGPITERAVKRFQSTHGLDVTGVVDAQTWAAIFRSKVVFMKAKDVPSVVREEIEQRQARPTTPTPATRTATTTSKGDATRAESRELGEDLRARDRALPEPRSAPAALGGNCGTVTPVKGTVTGTYGEDRGTHAHGGTDIAAPTGTPVKAASCGKVTTAGADNGGYGNLVCIEHEGGRTSCYAHLSTIAARTGQDVKAGQVIGTVGCTGRCSGAHLHFEVRENGRTVNPDPYLEGSSELSPAARQRMAAQRDTGSSDATAEAASAGTTWGQTGGGAATGGTSATTSSQPQRAHSTTGPTATAAAAPSATATPPPAPAPAPAATPAPAPAAPTDTGRAAEPTAPAEAAPPAETPAPTPAEATTTAAAPEPTPAESAPVADAPAPGQSSTPAAEASAAAEPATPGQAPAPTPSPGTEAAHATPAPEASDTPAQAVSNTPAADSSAIASAE